MLEFRTFPFRSIILALAFVVICDGAKAQLFDFMPLKEGLTFTYACRFYAWGMGYENTARTGTIRYNIISKDVYPSYIDWHIAEKESTLYHYWDNNNDTTYAIFEETSVVLRESTNTSWHRITGRSKIWNYDYFSIVHRFDTTQSDSGRILVYFYKHLPSDYTLDSIILKKDSGLVYRYFKDGVDGQVAMEARLLSSSLLSAPTFAPMLPTQHYLKQNYPNPFNPTTTFEFALPTASFTSFKIFDILGREVATITNEVLPAGSHSKVWNAAGFSSGIYFYTLRAGKFAETRKLLLLK
jgi:hypothetical protein